MPEYMNYIKLLSEYKLEIKHSFHTKLNKWNQNVINFLARQNFIDFLVYISYYTYYLYVCVCVYKSFSTTLDEGQRKNTNKKRHKNWKT